MPATNGTWISEGENGKSDCTVCGSKVGIKRCGNCHKVLYCSKVCQKKDWKTGHKANCIRDEIMSQSVRSSVAQPSLNQRVQGLGSRFNRFSIETEVAFRAQIIGNVTLCPAYSDDIIPGVFVQKQDSETEYIDCTYGDFRSTVE